MRHATGWLLIPALLLAGCGGRTDQAAEACETAIAERLQDEQYTVERTALIAAAETQADGIVHLRGPVVFKPGLPGEYKQTVECKVRFGDDAVDVISLSFYY